MFNKNTPIWFYRVIWNPCENWTNYYLICQLLLLNKKVDKVLLWLKQLLILKYFFYDYLSSLPTLIEIWNIIQMQNSLIYHQTSLLLTNISNEMFSKIFNTLVTNNGQILNKNIQCIFFFSKYIFNINCLYTENTKRLGNEPTLRVVSHEQLHTGRK